MNTLSVFFMLQFVVFIIITLYKVYNLMSNWEVYDLKMGFILFLSIALCFGVGLVTSILSVDTVLFFSLISLETWFFLPHVFFLVFEIFGHVKLKQKQVIKHYATKK